jgi:hypothetical protein
LWRKVNQLAELRELQPFQPESERGRGATELLRLYQRDAEQFDLLTAEEEVALSRKMERAEAARQELEEGGLDPISTHRLEAQVREGG